MIIFLTIVHILVCAFLILVVLMQSGKAADIVGAFGGMGSQTTFGPRGAATALTKATAIAAGLFMLTSLSLAILQTRNAGTGGAGSVLDSQTTTAPATAPAAQPGQATIPVPVQIPAQGGAAPATPEKK
jgi:preprotein translocase subunit SecG